MFLILLVGVWVFPYAILAASTVDFLPVAALGLVCSISVFVLNRRGSWSAKKLALGNMAVKLAQIPAYVMWFIFGAAFFLFGGPVMAFLVDALTIFLSGLVGLSAVLRCRKENILTRKQAAIHGILQFVFCADMFSAVWLFKESCKKKEDLL